MIERSSPTLDVLAPDGTTIITAIIKESSIRQFRLMEEDFLRIDFDTTSAVHIPIGAYVQDPVFGRFVVTKEQMPKYNPSDSSYTYSLQLDATYIEWGNRLFCLTTEVNSQRLRKEVNWTLTSPLADHVLEILHNLEALGITGFTADTSGASMAGEAHCMVYNGVSILEALTQLADSYECEWWMAGSVIHFGKCEDTTEQPVTFQLDQNVASMDIQDNRKTYANKVYVYGSTENLPFSYRRKLFATVTALSMAPGTYVYTLDKKLTADMLVNIRRSEFDIQLTSVDFPFYSAFANIGSTCHLSKAKYKQTIPENLAIDAITIGFTPDLYNTPTLEVTCTLYLGNVAIRAATIEFYRNDTNHTFNSLPAKFDDYDYNLPMNDSDYRLRMYISIQARYCTLDSSFPRPEITLVKSADGQSSTPLADSEKHIILNFNTIEGTADVLCKVNGQDRNFTFNSDGEIEIDSHDTPLSIGDVIEIRSKSYMVPSAYYANEYDNPSTLLTVGASRLRLPESTGDFLLPSGETGDSNRVEAVVVFDKIYPDGKCYASTISTKEMKDYTEYEGETETNDWQWEQYTLTPNLVTDGRRFQIKKEMVLPQQSLKIRFLAPQDVSGASIPNQGEYRLAGMTFGCQLNNDGTLTIERNSDFGALLPNEVLHPSVGDPFVLIGWNVYAMTELGLIENAEARLLAKGQEYMQALEEGQFTFTCTMMSDFLHSITPSHVPFSVQGDGDLIDSDGEALMVRNTEYAALSEGRRVTIVHPALRQSKTSRIIGYTLKADKPYDSPQYIVGETDAYSRLAKIEKEISTI